MDTINIGFVTDVQYADIENYKLCYYRKSLDKLSEAVDYFNMNNLEFVVQLGDFIEKDWKSYEKVFKIWNRLRHKSYHVLGNHDFEVENPLKRNVPKLFGLKETYYSISIRNWNFIFLNGNDLSLTAFPKTSKEYQISQKYLFSCNTIPNGGMGE